MIWHLHKDFVTIRVGRLELGYDKDLPYPMWAAFAVGRGVWLWKCWIEWILKASKKA